MLLAPLAVAPLGLAAGLVAWGGRELGLAPLGVAMLVVAAVVAGSRAFHVDGLADTADGLTSSYDATRSLAVMRSGDTGPAGVAAVVLVLGVQAGAVLALLALPRGPVLVGAAVLASRCAHALAVARGIPTAPGSRLAVTYEGALPVPVAAALWLAVGCALGAVAHWAGVEWWRGPLALSVAAIVVGLLVRRALRRLGGVTGDVFGAAIELSLACLLVGMT